MSPDQDHHRTDEELFRELGSSDNHHPFVPDSLALVFDHDCKNKPQYEHFLRYGTPEEQQKARQQINYCIFCQF